MSGGQGNSKKRDVPQKASKEETSTTDSGLIVPENIPISNKDKNEDRKTRNNPTTTLTIMYTNTDQQTSLKISELRELIIQQKPQILAICKVKLKNGIERTLQDYAINGYVLNHRNIDSTVGSGIAIYVHSSITNLVLQSDTTAPFHEACILEICLQGFNTMVFGCFYRSPTSNSASDENNDNLNAVLKNLALNKKYSHKCFVGDFNFKMINWNTSFSSHNEESKEEKFLETIHDCFLFQNAQEPTRCRGTDDPSTIDLIFTDEENQITDLQYQASLGKSDHSVI